MALVQNTHVPLLHGHSPMELLLTMCTHYDLASVPRLFLETWSSYASSRLPFG